MDCIQSESFVKIKKKKEKKRKERTSDRPPAGEMKGLNGVLSGGNECLREINKKVEGRRRDMLRERRDITGGGERGKRKSDDTKAWSND
jgi:hypothetical protein